MEIRDLDLGGVLEIVPKRFCDDRGFFHETYNQRAFAEAGINLSFVQDNHSRSSRGVLRGLHYQLAPRAQDKLVWVASGSILDVAVDVRLASRDFGKWVAVELSEEKGNQLLVPKGFAHGFLVLSDRADVVYKVTDTWSQAHERAIRFDDPALSIDWPGEAQSFLISAKDRQAPLLAQAELFT
jgi:dTDP-4-dehydrorhamnose 3,5-epimerase